MDGYFKKDIKDTRKHIDQHKTELRQKKKNRSKEEEEEEKKEDKDRSFLNMMRPPFCWNFFEDNEKKTPHILRHDAKPQECYIDGRVESILEDIEAVGHHLQRHEDVKWKVLRNHTLEIFKHQIKHEHEEAMIEGKKGE